MPEKLYWSRISASKRVLIGGSFWRAWKTARYRKPHRSPSNAVRCSDGSGPGQYDERRNEQELYYSAICRTIAATDYDGDGGQEFTPRGDLKVIMHVAHR